MGAPLGGMSVSSDGSKRSAQERRCPKCKRLAALSRIEPTIYVPITSWQWRWPDCKWGRNRDELQDARAVSD